MLLTKSRLPGADYVINPYVGCGFGCKYCYAKFMAKFVAGKHKLSKDTKKLQNNWGQWVVPKTEDVKRFKTELSKKLPKLKDKTVLLSSVTDPYQPLEAKLRLTQEILKVWRDLAPDAYLEILTRSALILRDLKLLSEIHTKSRLKIGISISVLPPKMFRNLEPFAPDIDARINTLIKLKQAKLKVYAFIAPVWPGQTAQLEKLIQKLKSHEIRIEFIELLNRHSRKSFKVDFEEKELLKIQSLARRLSDVELITHDSHG